MNRERLLYLGILVILLVGLLSSSIFSKRASGKPANQAPDLASLSVNDLKTLSIRLQRTPCYGNCPAYSVTIHGDGRVEYAGKEYVKVKEARSGQIDAAAIKVLASQFAQAKFLSLPTNDYTEANCKCRRCTDMATAIVEIKVGSVSHPVNHYYGCACPPKALFDLESAIDKAVNSEQWTGDTSKQGPMGTTCFG